MSDTDLERFFALVSPEGPVALVLRSTCWLWTGTTDDRGYPKFWLTGNAVTAQRAAMLLAGVALDPTQHVEHSRSLVAHGRR